MIIMFWVILISIFNYLLITTVVDAVLMGGLHISFARKCREKQFLIQEKNRIDMQTGYECSAFAAAYILRHHHMDAEGNGLYEIMPNKMKVGYVYPKGITRLLSWYGVRVRYCSGNLNALKNEVSRGNPVIVMLRTQVGKSWLHFVPVVGFDEENIYIAESMCELANCNEEYYNRRIGNPEFKKLWNTGMLKMPFYRNTYFCEEASGKD